MSGGSRRIRAFKRWMRFAGIEHSPSISIVDSGEEGIWIRALRRLHEDDIVATIPKDACLSIKTSGARELIEESGIAGLLGLSVAVMYERSRGVESPWAGYLQLMPENEPVPIAWSVEEIDELLVGTELHKIVKEDKILVYKDWKENIHPLIESEHWKLDPNFFCVEQYIAAKSLVGSRSFAIDDYYDSGMVPLADLFNHKTGSEDVHFTTVCSLTSSDDDDDDHGGNEAVEVPSDTITDDESSISDSNGKSSGDDPTKLEMILVKDVEAGAEIFNTYGSMGNAALLHRYGFTEPDNPFDIINIDMHLIAQWSSTASFSSRSFRRRVSLWRRLDFSGCISENSEYFEVTIDGVPQLELLVLLYIIFLTEESYTKLDFTINTFKEIDIPAKLILLNKMSGLNFPETTKKVAEEFLLTENVCRALINLADARELLYGSGSLEVDLKKLTDCCCVSDKKLYHSLVMRVSERTILEKLRFYGSQFHKVKKRKFDATQ